jgi:hypothetical protein
LIYLYSERDITAARRSFDCLIDEDDRRFRSQLFLPRVLLLLAEGEESEAVDLFKRSGMDADRLPRKGRELLPDTD